MNLALPLIRAAATAPEITPEDLLPDDSADEAPAASVFNIAFGSDVEDDILVREARAFPSVTDRLPRRRGPPDHVCPKKLGS